MSWKRFAKDYLSFTRKERVGLLAVIFIILLTILLPNFIHNKSTGQHRVTDTTWIAAARKLEIKGAANKERRTFKQESGDNDRDYQYDRVINSGTITLFDFDPNTLDEAGWKKLGLRDKTIITIRNYLSKGGHFNKPDDLKKIYGLSSKDYLRLEPFVKIEARTRNEEPSEYVKKENDLKPFYRPRVDINTADTSSFISLPGIGNKLALRIVSFRDKLGGFYSVGQIGETYGLPDSVFQKIKQYLSLGNSSVKKININTATVDELKVHPYIRYAIANPIVSYRNEHGPFVQLEDIKKVMAVTDEVYTKISPYLTLQ